MKLLFVGGTGNISTSVSRAAVAAGHELVLLNRGRRPGAIAGARSVAVDYRDARAVAAALGDERFDAAVNWIAFTPGDIEHDLAMLAPRAAQYVFISSASVYEKPPRSPFVTEETPRVNPFWDYSHRKILAEERLFLAMRDEGVAATIVRPSLTYDTVIPAAFASWDDATLLQRLRDGREVVIPGDGTSLWTITHAEDFAAGFLPLLGHPGALGEAFHLTSDEVLSWNDIYAAIAAAAGVEGHFVHLPSDFLVTVDPSLRGTLHGDKMWSLLFDNAKHRALVPGFRARIPFAEGIRRTVAWFDADPARRRIVPEHDTVIDRCLAAWRGRGARA